MAGAAITRLVGGKTDIVMMLNGALAGLVSITAEPLMPSPLLSIGIGAVGGIIMYYGTNLLNTLKLMMLLELYQFICLQVFGAL